MEKKIASSSHGDIMNDKIKKLLNSSKNIKSVIDSPVPLSQKEEENLDRENEEATIKLGVELDDVGHYHFWKSGKSISVNIALTGRLNFWMFSIFGSGLHGLWGRNIWNETDKTIYINPGWVTPSGMNGKESLASYIWPPNVDKIIGYVKNSDSISNIAESQLKKVEEKFGILIPNNVRNEIIVYCEKSAKRRLTANKFPAPKGKTFTIAQESEKVDNNMGDIMNDKIVASELKKIAKTLMADDSEAFNKLLDRVNGGQAVLTASEIHNDIPTIHNFAGKYHSSVDHMGYGLFKGKTESGVFHFDAGGAMNRTGSISWTILSATDEVLRDLNYDLKKVKKALEELAGKNIKSSVIKTEKLSKKFKKIAKTITSSWNQRSNEIKFVIGDLVKIGTRKNVWKIIGVTVEYPLYEGDMKYVNSISHQEANYEAIGWNPTSNENFGKDKSGYGKYGDKVKMKKNRGQLVEGNEYTIGNRYERYYGTGVNTNKALQNAEPQILEPAGQASLDDQDRTAIQAFEAEFGGLKGVYVIHSPYRTSSETLGRVIGYNDKGMIKIELYGLGKWKGQEEVEPDMSKVVETEVFKPKLAYGKWFWGNNNYSITPAKPNQKLTRLLD